MYIIKVALLIYFCYNYTELHINLYLSYFVCFLCNTFNLTNSIILFLYKAISSSYLSGTKYITAVISDENNWHYFLGMKAKILMFFSLI